MFVPNASPLYTAPDWELSTAITALAGLTLIFHAEMVPSSVSKMKAAGNFDPGTRNPVVGFQIMPVGEATEPACEPIGGGEVARTGRMPPAAPSRGSDPA